MMLYHHLIALILYCLLIIMLCHMELLDVHKSKYGNETNLNIYFSMKNEKICSGGSQTHNVLLHKAEALPTELQRQLS